MKRSGLIVPIAVLAMSGLSACEEDGVGPDSNIDPRDLAGDYSWIFQQWEVGSPRGYPAVELTWELPAVYSNEPFRVYGARAGGVYGLIATVTSCSEGFCEYTDTNVRGGQSYDYYVATYDERDGVDVGVSDAVRVDVPLFPTVTPPAAPRATALDGAAFLTWEPTGAQLYRILAEGEDNATFLIGETDGTSFLDDRAANGVRYRYFIAGSDAEGHVSALSPSAQAIPRPDFHAELLYVHADSAQASGFRFVSDENSNPIMSGTSGSAQWRLEATATGQPRIVPLLDTAITGGTFTTQLSCGPGSDQSCEDVRVAPASGQFSSAPVTVEAGRTYVLRVTGADNRLHYGKIRIQGATTNTAGRRLIVFDWAYQLRADEPSLQLIGN
jgi:hypothetical protein